MRILGFGAMAVSLFLCAVSGLVLVPSCAPGDSLDDFPRLWPGLDFQGGATLTYELEIPEDVDADEAAMQALDVLRRRLDSTDVPASVRRRGTDLVVEIPSTDHHAIAWAKAAIGTSSTLEFRVVDDLSTVLDSLGELPAGVERETETVTDWRDPLRSALSITYLSASGLASRGRLEQVVAPIVVGERQIVLGRHESLDRATPEPGWRTYVVYREAHVDGSMVADAFVTTDDMTGRPNVMVELDARGREAFAQMTTVNVKRRIAIMLDGEVTSAPVVQEPITGGRAQITLGSYRSHEELMREANELVVILRAGALPSPIHLADESVVGATFGGSALFWLAIGALVLLLLLVGAGAVRYRGSAIVLVMPLAVVLPGLAALALMEATVNLPLVLGAALAALAALVAGVVVAERIRRIHARPVGHVINAAIAPAVLLALALVGVVVYVAATGGLRGFATGLFVSALAGSVLTPAWSIATSALFTPRAAV